MATLRGLEKLARVLSAVRKVEEASLKSYRLRAAAARNQAIALKAAGKRVPGLLGREVSVVDFKALGSWQAHTDRGARQAEAKAAVIEEEAQPLSRQLATTIGRETMVQGMIDAHRRELAARAERREEVDQVRYRSRSASGS